MHRRIRHLLTGLLALACSLALLLVGSPSAGAANSQAWTGTWGASPVGPDSSGLSATGFTNQTMRNIVHLSVGGNHVRVRLSNAFGTAPVTVTTAHVAERDVGASTYPGTDRTLTFGGGRSYTIPPGAEALSDPVSLQVTPGEDLAVSLYFRGATGPVSWHPLGTSTSYYSDSGNEAGASSAQAFTEPAGSWYVLDGVDVSRSDTSGAVVAFGDSITDGYQSTPDANLRWPDDLSRRIQASMPAGDRMSVIDEGISGNRVLSDAGTAGVSAQARYGRDVLDQTGVRDIIYVEGINDIGTQIGNNDNRVTANQLITADQNLIARAHAQGLRILGGTLTPYGGAFYYSNYGEHVREQVNTWIRTSGAFDGVVDFDKATRDPAHPTRFLPQYDSGDHLHPNDAGYQAMADAINLAQL